MTESRSFNICGTDVHLHCADFRTSFGEGIKADMILADPPHEALERHRAIGTTTRLTGEWFDILSDDKIGEFLEFIDDRLAKNAHIYLWSNDEAAYTIHAAAMACSVKWKYWNTLQWVKLNSDGSGDVYGRSVSMGMGYHYRHAREQVLFFEKGKKALSSPSDLNVFHEQKTTLKNHGHPTSKPTYMQSVLVSQSAPDGVIMDPYLGSGSSMMASIGIAKTFYGYEVSEVYFNAAVARLEALEAWFEAVGVLDASLTLEEMRAALKSLDIPPERTVKTLSAFRGSVLSALEQLSSTQYSLEFKDLLDKLKYGDLGSKDFGKLKDKI